MVDSNEQDKKSNQNIDPITSMSVEIESLKSEIASSKKLVDDNNKLMSQVINTNKSLMAEISTLKGSIREPENNVPSNDVVAYEALKKSLNIK
jgi:predicted  nucleic acid-binding Zn-ribbon protein